MLAAAARLNPQGLPISRARHGPAPCLPSLPHDLETTRDQYGGVRESWVSLGSVWAEVNQTGVSETFENDADITLAKRNARITIRWRGDLNEIMTVVYDGLRWDIEGIAEVGFRQFLELYVQTDVRRTV